MKDFIRKLFGLPSQADITKMTETLFEIQLRYDQSIEQMFAIQDDMRTLRNDMKTLYADSSGEISRVKRELKLIKPVLKVEDPEAIKFIKGILSKHDHNLNTQQSFLETKMIELNRAEGQANKAITIAAEAATKINNVIVGLGLNSEEPTEEIYTKLRSIIKEAHAAGPLQVE